MSINILVYVWIYKCLQNWNEYYFIYGINWILKHFGSKELKSISFELKQEVLKVVEIF